MKINKSMSKLFHEIVTIDKIGFIRILLLNTLTSFMGSIGIVMLIPMMSLLDISVGENSWLNMLLIPFYNLNYSTKVFILAAIYVILLIFQAVINRKIGIEKGKFIEKQDLHMRKELYKAIQKADWESLSDIKRMDYINLFTTQCGQFGNGVMQIIELISSIVSAAMKIVIACMMSVSITVFVLIFGGVFLRVLYPYYKKSRSYGKEILEINKNFFNELFYQLSSIKETRTYGIKKNDEKRFFQQSNDFYNSHINYMQTSSIPQMWYSIGASVVIAIVFIFCLLVVHIQTAQLMILVYVFARLWPIFSSWQSRIQNINASLPAYEAVKEAIKQLSLYCDEDLIIDQYIQYAQSIKVDNITFYYRNTVTPVLKNITFELPYGTVTALIGKSGAGKSTLADIVLGLLTPTSGNILIDNIPLTKGSMSSWHKMIGYVPQEPVLLNASIRENLLRFHPLATEEEMIGALKKALAWDFIQKLDKGIDTLIGEQGIRLSGGERQRIVLARVLIGNPKLIVLDEATSALDFESEAEFKKTIQSLKKQTTSLIIAHRLATIKIADYGVVLDNGLIIEQGKLTELTNNSDSYLSKMERIE